MQRIRTQSGAAALCLLLSSWIGVFPRLPLFAEAPKPPPPRVTEITTVVTLDAVGNGKLVIDYTFPPDVYPIEINRSRPLQPDKPDGSPPPPKPPEIAIFFRTTTVRQMWLDFDNIKGRFDEDAHSIHLECTVRGLARTGRGDVWESLLRQKRGVRPDQLEIKDNTAVLKTTTETLYGQIVETYQIAAPAGSDRLELLREPSRLAYHLAAEAPAGAKTSVDFRFEVKPYVMTCAAKCYSSPDDFPQLWAARTILRNTGDKPIKDYRVRFRLADYTTDWSEWRRVDMVLPGQTVVDPYFPILDIDKVNHLEGRRATSLKVEYEYKQADGEQMRDDSSRRLEILGHNELVFSSLPPEEQNGDFLNMLNNGPLGLACYVTKDDPVIREAAGIISGKIPGLDATGWTDESARAFMYASYDFLQQNKVAYQLPPGLFDGREMVQHVKYGRDVLQNHAGTCIDLAIFFGSVCEAVGLEPVLIMVPGHCFPAVRLPQSKQLFAVESTRIQRQDFFTSADEANEGLMQQVVEGKIQAHVVDISALRKQGVSGMELPALPDGSVARWRYEQGGILDWVGKMVRIRPPKAGEPFDNSIGVKLVLVPAVDKFTFGSPKTEAERNDDEIQLPVRITKPFLMGVHEVTQAEYEKLMGKNPSWFSKTGGGNSAVEGQDTSRFPVEQVTWDEANTFCEKLSELPAEKAAGRKYRLPTEAEWEYACRAGTETTFQVGDLISSKDANIVGNKPYLNSPEGPTLKRTTAVGSYQVNKFGLYDMHGNVAEWCLDRYSASRAFHLDRIVKNEILVDIVTLRGAVGVGSEAEPLVVEGVAIDPAGAAVGATRVLRGGSFISSVNQCRSAARRDRDPNYSHRSVGFRVLCVLP